MHCNGQLSLEYLLLLAAVLGIFSLLLPLLNNVFAASLFGLDSVNAKRFSQQLQQAVEETSFQADGAATLIEAEPLGKWRLFSEKETLFILVSGPSQREKGFEVVFPNPVVLETTISHKTVFVLRKHDARILLEHN